MARNRTHSRGVTRNYLPALNSVDMNGFWDNVYREKPYFENSTSPDGPLPDDPGRMKGEFDVLAVNYDQKVFLYVEVKSNARGYRKARDQLDRAETHFEDAGWDMIGQVWLED